MALDQIHRSLLTSWKNRYNHYEAAQFYLKRLKNQYPALPEKIAEGHVSYTYLCYCLDRVKEICSPDEQKEAMDHLFTVHMGNVYDNSGIDGIDFEQTYDHIRLVRELQQRIDDLTKDKIVTE
jgi:hypothetical protein